MKTQCPQLFLGIFCRPKKDNWDLLEVLALAYPFQDLRGGN